MKLKYSELEYVHKIEKAPKNDGGYFKIVDIVIIHSL
jgi:hypothetical protein